MRVRLRSAMLWVAALAPLCPSATAQTPVEIVRQAVDTELAADRDDHSHWRYSQEEKLPADSIWVVVETAQGSVKEKVEQEGRPLSPDQQAAEAKRIQTFIHDTDLQAKQKRDSQHDDESAEKLLRLLPVAFTWTLENETPQRLTLAFVPKPSFQPSGMEARVMSSMGGEMVVDRAQHRIYAIRGKLAQDVNIGFGILGKLRQGGTFDVERREIAPGLWQITETHVHIDGRALLFKSIGQQQDEVNFGYTRVPEGTSLEQAVSLLSARGVSFGTRAAR